MQPRAGSRRRALILALAIQFAGQGALAPVAQALAATRKSAPAEASLPRDVTAADDPTSPLDVRVGIGPHMSRLEFHGVKFTGGKREGAMVILHFATRLAPLIPRLHVDPPPYLKDADARVVNGGVEVRLTLAPGADATIGESDGSAYVNLFQAPDQAPVAKDGAAGSGHSDPVPADGSVRMAARMDGPAAVLRFPWRSPLGAAVFRRGDGVWIVFDAPTLIDIAGMPLARNTGGRSPIRSATVASGKDYSAVRLSTASNANITAEAEGSVWTVTVGAPTPSAPDPVTVASDETGSVGLTASMAGSTGVFWVADPVIGDKLAVVTALSPLKGVTQKRTFVGGAVLATAQGMAIEAVADGMTVTASRDVVKIGRPMGLALAATGQDMHYGAAAMGDPQPAIEPAVIDFANWSKVGEGGFNARYAELLSAAAEEAGKHLPGKVQARLALARFLVGSELSFEAIGVLNLLAKTDQGVLGNAEFRGLRGAAKAMSGRYKDAIAEFSAPALAEERSAALWRAYLAAKVGDLTSARQQFALGRLSLPAFSGKWKARFARAAAEADLSGGDTEGARQALAIASSAGAGDQDDELATKLVMAKLLETTGRWQEALTLYDEVGGARYGAVGAPATLRALQIRIEHGQMKSADAAATLDSLRYRWRGDATELEVVRTLGRIDLAQGRYRDALEVLRSASKRLSDLPAAAAIATDLSQSFRTLFLDGRADGLQPIQALGLFYDFKDLTPIGADGDTMVRKLAHRLVDVDLLPQAAELLKYQAEQRLDGVARADVSTDLATIYLMDHKPEDALGAINNSRTTVLPSWLNAQRRLIEARALMALGRTDHALEVLGQDKSPEVAALRAEAAWSARDWPHAATMLEGLLGDRWKSPAPLSADEEARLTRAGIAYSLAGDDAALTRLRTRYGKLVESAKQKDVLRVALTGMAAGDATPAAYGRAVAEVDSFSGWVAAMKKKFLEKTDTRVAQGGGASTKG